MQTDKRAQCLPQGAAGIRVGALMWRRWRRGIAGERGAGAMPRRGADQPLGGAWGRVGPGLTVTVG
ncbi:hypothetical protein Y88_2351 [Novosphingobium nitrogenifigens DSM 19370]|uniref:Uncharacterized protein n=1 Tax=Novosphingobium nitrogenifigens DSM 19370 TaxID=983920 RepID=F1Z6C8_9SPHN|nr:hypothetical protein Y88_2351 [Novosphingobium nitrogenifigens DSM 19370]